MAYFVQLWLQAQRRKCAHFLVLPFKALRLRCFEHRRMKSWIAYGILGVLGLLVIFSASRCSYSSTQTINVAYDKGPPKIRQSKSKMASSSTGCSNATFSVTTMSELFQKCATSGLAREVDMDKYLDAWDELIRFLNSMGKAFTFVSSDVVDKIGILRKFRSSSDSEHYITIEKMILYEKESDLINYKEAPSKKVPPSGSRTLLRLHRALKFLLILIGKLARNDDNGKVSLMGYNAYHASPMSKYHPWIVQKAVGVAVYMLPDRNTFIKQMCQDMPDEELAKVMQVCSESMDAVYEYSEALYSKYDITEIP